MDIKKLLNEMTLDEKIGQLNQYTVNYFTDAKSLIVIDSCSKAAQSFE